MILVLVDFPKRKLWPALLLAQVIPISGKQHDDGVLSMGAESVPTLSTQIPDGQGVLNR
jgi:hypothetical protein